MAKKKTEPKKADKKASLKTKDNTAIEDIKVEAKPESDVASIVITETEDDIVLDSGFDGDPDNLKNSIKKEAAKSAILSRFLIPLFVFIIIGLVAGGFAWYYSRPEITTQKTQEEKIETPPKVETPATTNPAPSTTTPAPAAAAPAAQATSYVVKSGDTLSSIANANGLTSKQLADYNGITNADSLTIGQTLKIPPK